MRKKIGLMCGTFDPPHIGHLILAQTAFTQLDLDQVLFLPVGDPTHKTTGTPAEHRLKMTQLAINDNPAFCLDSTDAVRPGPHYTATLLPLIKRAHPQADLWLIIGGDSLSSFPNWYRPLEILTHCRLAVLDRPTFDIETIPPGPLNTALSNQVDRLNGPSVDLSSTWLRKRFSKMAHKPQPANAASFQYLLPPAVAQYIISNHIYAK